MIYLTSHLRFLVFAFVVLLTCACSKEKEEPSVSSDPCEGIICEPPKFCNLGGCVCPTGYTGANCDEEVTPSQVRITKITVQEFPMEDSNGDPWDADGAPDITIGLLYKTADPIWETALVFENATSPGMYVFNVDGANLDDMEFEYGLYILDIDIEQGETTYKRIGGVNVIPYTPGQDFPKEVTFTFSESRGTSKVSVEFVYTF